MFGNYKFVPIAIAKYTKHEQKGYSIAFYY